MPDPSRSSTTTATAFGRTQSRSYTSLNPITAATLTSPSNYYVPLPISTMSQYSAGSISNIGARGRASSADWHDEYKHLDDSHYDPSSFFDVASPTKLLASTSPPKPPLPATMSTFPAASLGPGSSYGFGLGLGNDTAPGGSSAVGGGTAVGTSIAATASLGPGGFSLSPGMGAGATTATATDLGDRFGTLPSASLGPGGLGFGSGPGGLGFSNGFDNGFSNGFSNGVGNGVGNGFNRSTGAPVGGGLSPYGYPPMPVLGSGPIEGLSTSNAESWFDQTGATLQLSPVEQQIGSPSDYMSQYAFQGVICVDDPAAAAAAAAATAAAAAAAAAAASTTAGDLTPKKPSTKRAKSTGGKRSTKSKTTVKKKKKPSAKRPRRKSAPASISLKDAKSELSTNDVVMGRGGLANHHVGNNTFRTLTASLKPEYARLPKDEKTDVSHRLLKMVHARGGKFLAKDSVSDLFYEVDNKIARRKCSQALREESKAERAARKSRTAQEGDGEEEDGEEDEEEN